MRDLDHKEDWGPKNWCFWTVVLGKTLESPLDSKEIKSVNPKGNQQQQQFTGRTDAKAEAPVLWPPDASLERDDSLEKTVILGKIEGGREEKGVAEDETVGWHHCLNRHESEQAPADRE